MSNDPQRLYQCDLKQSMQSRAQLRKNRNLLSWYRALYRDLFGNTADTGNQRVLEIGSGASPLELFLPDVITSDVLTLEHLDLVFDCHEIAELTEIADHSIDVITLTNVLHHLRDPIHFLLQATRKLKPGGQLVAVEPYFSIVSYPLFRFLHHEPVDFHIDRPVLDSIEGPLSTANQAIPYMIFFSRPDWLALLSNHYDLEKTRYGYFTSLAYMATGGVSRAIPVPHWIYLPYLTVDRLLARALPSIFASFFSVRLVSR